MKTLITTFAILTVAACGEDTGTITSTAYGEEFIEEGIPSDVFSDGWAVTYDRFLVSIGNAKAQAGHDHGEVGFDDFFVVDLAKPSNGEGTVLSEFDAPGGTYDHYGYQIIADASALDTNADDADFTAMKANGYSIWVAGSASKSGVTKTFDWGFKMKLTYAHCEAGMTIDGDNVVMQSTIHADHLFYDDAVSDEPNVAFDLFATADADNDNAITLEELGTTDIRTQTRYQVGSNRDLEGKEITNLRQFLEKQVTTVGHINGEGHCEDTIATL
jgi:hypothetical protein